MQNKIEMKTARKTCSFLIQYSLTTDEHKNSQYYADF